MGTEDVAVVSTNHSLKSLAVKGKKDERDIISEG